MKAVWQTNTGSAMMRPDESGGLTNRVPLTVQNHGRLRTT